MTRPKVISLYSGAGGLDYGFEAAGFETAVALEMDSDCCNSLRESRPDWTVIQSDINKVPTSDILKAAHLKPRQADVLIGGPPCQPFSKSGYWKSGDSRRLSDPRASTLAAYLRVLEEALPKAFLLENVEGLGFKGKDEGLQFIQQGLEDINRRNGTKYSATMRVVNAADYGVPQTRRRLIMVGSRDGLPFRFPDATHADPAERGSDKLTHVTAWAALHDLDRGTNDDLRMKGKWAELLPTIPEGDNYLWHTDRSGGVPLFGWRRRFWNFLLKAAKDRPVWTLQAQPGPATGPFHWESRRFSRHEMARLQTFPDSVTITGSLADAHRQLGNAVPSLLAEVMARAIMKQIIDPKADLPELPRLVVPDAPPVPPPMRPTPVPKKFLALAGEHEAHPGTGLGYAAVARTAAHSEA